MLVAVRVYTTMSPTAPDPETDAVLPVMIAGAAAAVARTTVSDVLPTVAPPGVRPVAVAVSLMLPVFTSLCRTWYMAVAVTLWFGSSVPAAPEGHAE